MTMTLDGTELDRAGIIRMIVKANDEAKAISRRGKVGTLTNEYRDAHDSINDGLRALERCD